jgi:hypothetical protein
VCADFLDPACRSQRSGIGLESLSLKLCNALLSGDQVRLYLGQLLVRSAN